MIRDLQDSDMRSDPSCEVAWNALFERLLVEEEKVTANQTIPLTKNRNDE